MDPLTVAALVGIGVSVFTGGAMGVSAVLGNEDAIDSLEKQLDYIEELYTLKSAEADLKYSQAKETAEKNAAIANKQADITDLAQDVTEVATSENFNAAIDNMYLSQIEDNMSWNAQSRAIGQAEGSTLATLAGSGIRAGSSLSQAVEMEAATNQAQLQFSQDAKRKSDDNNLGIMLANLAGTKVDIYGTRVSADTTRQQALDLVNSYLEGGYNYNLYLNQKSQMKTAYENDKRLLEDQIDQRSGFWGGVKAFFGGFASGYTNASNLTSMLVNDFTTYKTAFDSFKK